MDRCAVFVDAGCLHAEGGKQTGVSLRGQDSLKRNARKVFWERIGRDRTTVDG